MRNPITTNTRYFWNYALIWGIIGAIHLGAFIFFYPVSFIEALSDTIIHNSLFFLLGLVLWYVVRFAGNAQKKLIVSLLNYFIAGQVMIISWVFVSVLILEALPWSSDTYKEVLTGIIPFRLLLGLVFTLIIVLVYYLIRYYMDIQDKILRHAQLEEMIRKTELDALKNQLNPHFLFNSLNSISSLTITHPEKACEMTIKLSEFLRYSLKQDALQTIGFKQELEHTQLYLDIERIRFGNKLLFTSDIDENALKCLVPNLILQPLFENAVKHGVQQSDELVTIHLDAKQTHNDLLLKVTNNFDPQWPSAKGKGIGLDNIRNRLKLIYNRHGLLQVKKEADRFTVSLTIPQLAAIITPERTTE